MTSSTTSPGAVLLLGGTGKVGRRLAPLLQAAGIPALVASRSGDVKFDWFDESTWEPIFATPIESVYFVCTTADNHVELSKKFIDLAVAKGVKRIVLLGASSVEEGRPFMGEEWAYLRELGKRGKIGWAVLRPTWFMENFSESYHVKEIQEGKLYSATGAGRVPWISTHDIAAVGFHALTSPEPPNTDFVILGSELLTYQDIASIFTAVLGRKIAYEQLSVADMTTYFISLGLPADYAPVLAGMEGDIGAGAEDRTNDVVRTVTGKEPRRFREFVEQNRAVWS
ncbi:putative ergot alkaloid A [Jackrogersella minutella]|nr:putative ergot alkaloid A [Jackrogersella minutella]